MGNEIEILKLYKIGVLAGGPSREREISLKSGKAVFDALTDLDLETVFIDVKEEDVSRVIDAADIDIAFIALHGRFGEDGTVQKILEDKNIPYTGSGTRSSRIALDKIGSRNRFAEDGLTIPEYRVVDRKGVFAEGEHFFPCVVKPQYEGSSIGLSVVRHRDDMGEAVRKAADCGGRIIVEKFIPGRELTVGVLDGRPLPVVEIVPAEGVYDFDAKYRAKDTMYVVPAGLDEDDYKRVQEAGLKAHQALGCEGFSRVDIRFSDKGRIYILEVNTIPGLTERSLLPKAAAAAGVTFPGLCVKILMGALAKKSSMAGKEQ